MILRCSCTAGPTTDGLWCLPHLNRFWPTDHAQHDLEGMDGGSVGDTIVVKHEPPTFHSLDLFGPCGMLTRHLQVLVLTRTALLPLLRLRGDMVQANAARWKALLARRTRSVGYHACSTHITDLPVNCLKRVASALHKRPRIEDVDSGA